MIFRTVSRTHPICRAEFTGDAAAFWDWVELSPVPNALVAYEGGQGVVAWLRYHYQKRDRHFWDAGVWVAPTHRKKGLARILYGRALAQTKARSVTIATISGAGRVLVASLVRDFPKVAWQVEGKP